MAAAKKGLLAMLGDPSGSPTAGAAVEEETGGDGKTEAAQSLLDAIDAGDADGVASAFQALYDHCSAGPMDDDVMDA